MRTFFMILTAAFLISVSSWAEQKVIYSQTVTTDFTFHWPLRTVRTYNAVQTKPYYYTGRILYLDENVDVSKFRFHYADRTCGNEWGYFFVPGTKLCNHNPYIIFQSPRLYSEKLQLK